MHLNSLKKNGNRGEEGYMTAMKKKQNTTFGPTAPLLQHYIANAPGLEIGEEEVNSSPQGTGCKEKDIAVVLLEFPAMIELNWLQPSLSEDSSSTSSIPDQLVNSQTNSV